MYKSCNIVMLPTNEKATDVPFSVGITLCNDGKLRIGNPIGYSEKRQHLYITSNEEINGGDWCVLDLSENTRIVQVKSLNSGHSIFNVDIIDGYAQLNNLKKIIATTDILPIYKAGIEIGLFIPKLSKEFIEAYIKAYNKCKQITEVEIEYEDLTEQLQESVDNLRDNCLEDFNNEEESPYYHLLEQAIIELGNYIPKLKVNPDNTINIKPIKDNWNKEEVIKLLNDFGEHVCEQLIGHKLSMIGELNKWCKENL